MLKKYRRTGKYISPNDKKLSIDRYDFRRDNNRMIEVAAAVLENREGEVLIARRRPEMTLGGYWEFPGGKIESGETPAQCAARELQEEMEIHIETGPILCDNVHDYGGGKIVHLIAVQAALVGGIFRLHDHDEIRWVHPRLMADYLFAPADEPIAEYLRLNRPLS